jgi:phenylacetaldehyde dehydrogenase
VPPGSKDQLIGALIRHLKQLVIGDPFDESTTFGPQANPVQADTVRARIAQFAEAGARIVTVGSTPSSGNWVAPTLVIDPPANLAGGERFGPVLVIRTIASTATAIEESHQLETGLAGYVFTRDLTERQHVGAQLPAGGIKINGTSLLDMSDRSAQTFWHGSGIGGHGAAELLCFFTGARIVGEDLQAPI